MSARVLAMRARDDSGTTLLATTSDPATRAYNAALALSRRRPRVHGMIESPTSAARTDAREAVRRIAVMPSGRYSRHSHALRRWGCDRLTYHAIVRTHASGRASASVRPSSVASWFSAVKRAIPVSGPRAPERKLWIVTSAATLAPTT